MHHPEGVGYADITYFLCSECGLVASFRPNKKGSEAIAAWNTRKDRLTAAARLAAFMQGDIMKITLGKLGQNIPGPASPTLASQLFTAQGNYKFTVDFGTKPGSVVVANDLGFDDFMALSQTQNNKGVTWGAANAGGTLVAQRQAQQSMLIYRASTPGQADLVEAPKLRFEGTGIATFTYGKDN